MKTAILIEPEVSEQTIHTIYRRRSVRRFLPTPVPEELINKILNAGRMAPSAMNHQPWHFHVLTDRASIQALSADIASMARAMMENSSAIPPARQEPMPIDFFEKADPIFHDAPVVVFVSGPITEWTALDIGMCCENMMLAAKAFGLDSCPVGLAKFITQSPLYPQLLIPPDMQIYLAIIIGYGDETPLAHARVIDNARSIPPLDLNEAHRMLMESHSELLILEKP